MAWELGTVDENFGHRWQCGRGYRGPWSSLSRIAGTGQRARACWALCLHGLGTIGWLTGSCAHHWAPGAMLLSWQGTVCSWAPPGALVLVFWALLGAFFSTCSHKEGSQLQLSTTFFNYPRFLLFHSVLSVGHGWPPNIIGAFAEPLFDTLSPLCFGTLGSWMLGSACLPYSFVSRWQAGTTKLGPGMCFRHIYSCFGLFGWRKDVKEEADSMGDSIG